jgi:cbb3-type cytochrome oxidase cytochrome c subunit
MKTGVSVFLAAFFALGASWMGFVYGSIHQLGGAKQTVVLESGENWPQQRTGQATLGLQVYRASGCAACHTEQVRQIGVADELSLLNLGTNLAAGFKNFVETNMVAPELLNVSNTIADNLGQWDGRIPMTIYSGQDSAAVASLGDKLKAAGYKADARVIPAGSDIWRGWGMRQSVAADYLYDEPVQLGSLRAGPDLSIIGIREPDLNWQLQHLYAPRSLVKDSTMPAFRFLFEVRKIGAQPSPDALALPKDFAPADGLEVVPTARARELAAYLVSLKANQPLYEAPFTPVAAK